jgi:serine/threonine protein kinase
LTPERWQQISHIFKSAITLDSEARRAYVAEKCGTDESLRSEVEKLIASHQQASDENFIGGHAAEAAAELVSEEVEEHKPTLNKGQQFGAYFILDRLGAGGMGEVYLARDSRLDRTVALKVLSADVSSDKRRMQRFRQEAKVASSLNQPNILTIFEFGEVDGLTFLATEFIDGETLRDHLRGNRLKFPEILDIAIQILAALDAAHDARIVHRDMKPENVMIRRRDHVVKVLDFGLAKLTERSALPTDHSELEAATAMKTAPGTLMGTINYMSPEQAQSQPVDQRSDIWSTGVMLYEMVAGAKPFGGPTTGHTLVQIIDKEPPPLPKAAGAPAELQRIILKAMTKSAEDRYQTAKDMLIDLKHLRRQLESTVGATDDTDDTDRGSKKTRVLVVALVAMAVVTAGIFGFNIWRASRSRSYVVPVTTTSAPAPAPVIPARTLTYWMTVQQYRDGRYKDPFTVAGELIFEKGDRVRLNVRSPEAGHLYIVSEGPRTGTEVPGFNFLFPSATANKNLSLLNAGKAVRLPEESWWQFDKDEGVERLWLIFAEDAVSELENAKKFASTKTRGSITDDVVNKSIQDLLTTHSASKHEAEKNDEVTTVKSADKILVHPIRLEHH